MLGEHPVQHVEDGGVAIGFSTVKRNPISTLIRWMTGAKVSHVWLLVRLFGVLTVIEASEKGFMPSMSYNRFRKRNTVVSIIVVDHDMHAGLAWAARHFGARYDLAGLIGMAWIIAGAWFHRRLRNPWNLRKALFCSEAVVHVLQKSRFPGAECMVASRTTPQELLHFFETLPSPNTPSTLQSAP